MTVATALAVSWKPLTNSKPRAISKCQAEQNPRHGNSAGELGGEGVEDIGKAAEHNQSDHDTGRVAQSTRSVERMYARSAGSSICHQTSPLAGSIIYNV